MRPVGESKEAPLTGTMHMLNVVMRLRSSSMPGALNRTSGRKGRRPKNIGHTKHARDPSASSSTAGLGPEIVASSAVSGGSDHHEALAVVAATLAGPGVQPAVDDAATRRAKLKAIRQRRKKKLKKTLDLEFAVSSTSLPHCCLCRLMWMGWQEYSGVYMGEMDEIMPMEGEDQTTQ